MFAKANVRKILSGTIALILLTFSGLSYADWGVGVNIGSGGGYHRDDRHFYRYHDHPRFGLRVSFLPYGYNTVWVGGSRYYYYDGLYYTAVGGGEYVLVNPPVGAYVSAIPPDFQPVFINGVTYYTNNGVYYILTRHHGYRVVAQPVVYVQQPTVVVAQPPVQAGPVVYAQDSFSVNVPNDRGGYVAVVLKRSGNGYVGPQGEFYAQFPKVAQLKAMYGK